MTVLHENPTEGDDTQASLEKLHASFTEGRSQSLAHLSPDQLRGIFQMLAPTMLEAQEDAAVRGGRHTYEEVIARYALGGVEIAELENFSASGDDASDLPPAA